MTDMQEIETENFARLFSSLLTPHSIRVVDWNIDRGLQLSAVIEFLAAIKAELVMLQEVDLNARRTHRFNIAKEIARRLQMNYVFGREFAELSQGTKTSPAYQGQATLSRWPLSNARVIRFREQSKFWRPRWYLPRSPIFQERLGGRIALVAEVHAGARTLVTYNLHLESRGDERLRRAQLREVLADAQRYGREVPLIIAGDMNLDASQDRVAADISRAMLLNAFSGLRVPTTTPRSIFDRGRVIDWLFTRGPLQVAESTVHRSVRASDHYPLSVRVDLL